MQAQAGQLGSNASSPGSASCMMDRSPPPCTKPVQNFAVIGEAAHQATYPDVMKSGGSNHTTLASDASAW